MLSIQALRKRRRLASFKQRAGTAAIRRVAESGRGLGKPDASVIARMPAACILGRMRGILGKNYADRLCFFASDNNFTTGVRTTAKFRLDNL